MLWPFHVKLLTIQFNIIQVLFKILLIEMEQSFLQVNSALGFFLGTLQYDTMFDYSNELTNPALRHVVKKAYIDLMFRVKPILDGRNAKRLKKGHLTFPYIVPGWITNGIST